ncbi:MAG TPA: hypothetical protein VKA36_03530 [Solirubrobacterales bacterium]|nr:hypothetical protein [Solirubrobacterales bacterium]
MDRGIMWRAAAVQAAGVISISVVLAIALPKSFFEDWGWLSGPGAWAACALITAQVLDLPRWRTLLGAALAGIPSLVAVIAGVHWLGALFAIALFALWCGAVAGRSAPATSGA